MVGLSLAGKRPDTHARALAFLAVSHLRLSFEAGFFKLEPHFAGLGSVGKSAYLHHQAQLRRRIGASHGFVF